MAGLMTRGVRAVALPHPALSSAIKVVIVRALISAWEHVLKEENDALALGEVRLTARLVRVLNRIRDEAGPGSAFSARVFQTVVRGGELESFDGKHLEKRPDLVFRLLTVRSGVASSEYDGLFVECKVVDATHPVKAYWTKGIARFLSGDYGWAMREGLMIAYRGDAHAIGTSLAPLFKKNNTTLVLLPPPAGSHECSVEHAVSRHPRKWTYRSGEAPGEIELRHLWVGPRRALDVRAKTKLQNASSDSRPRLRKERSGPNPRRTTPRRRS